MRLNFRPAAFKTCLVVAFLAACAPQNKDSEHNSQPALDSSLQPRVIYGEDNRQDIYEIKDARLLQLARSTAVLIDQAQLHKVSGGYQVESETFQKKFNLCPSEKFALQNSAGFCSGFLVDAKTFVTAGHCVRSQSACEKTAFAFDFHVTSPNDPGANFLPSENVFSCRKLVRSYIDGGGADYAVIELDREVKGRQHLPLRTVGSAEVGTPLVVIGHPSGIPTKVAGGASIRSQEQGFFIANLDTYGGNSGSAVFNARTGVVEGILVRGETDFVYKNGCRVSNLCADDGCRGEDVTHITEVVKNSKVIKPPKKKWWFPF